MSLSRRVPASRQVSTSLGPRSTLVSGLSALALLAALTVWPVPAQSQAPLGSATFQGLASNVFDDARDDYRMGLGFNFSGSYSFHSFFDVRADLGFRWIEGENTLVRQLGRPDLGGQAGETTQNLRVMPFTLGLIYRAEQWSQGRFWVPYVGLGAGFYDVRAEFANEETFEERHANLFKVGYHGRAGVNFHRTSGMFMNVEAAVHAIDTDREWTPLYDVSVGVGVTLPMQP